MISKKNPLFFIFLLTSCLSLTACVNMATTGAQAVYNRHTIQKNVNDQMITMKAYHILNYKNDELFKNAHISIATFNSDVLLAGEAPETWQRKKAEALVQKIPGVKNVYNFISQEQAQSHTPGNPKTS